MLLQRSTENNHQFDPFISERPMMIIRPPKIIEEKFKDILKDICDNNSKVLNSRLSNLEIPKVTIESSHKSRKLINDVCTARIEMDKISDRISKCIRGEIIS